MAFEWERLVLCPSQGLVSLVKKMSGSQTKAGNQKKLENFKILNFKILNFKFKIQKFKWLKLILETC